MSEESLIARLSTEEPGFQSSFNALRAGQQVSRPEIDSVVTEIIERVRNEGDPALLEYTRRFDSVEAESVAELEIAAEDLKAAFDALDAVQREALLSAAQRIRDYHEHQRQESWQYQDDQGNLLGQRITPLDRVGVYVPGGKAAYPSSVLMNTIPARVAGVPEIVMVAPAPYGEVSPIVLAAAHVAGVDRFFRIGGAQAVAALAWGTDRIPAVDKVVGPGNVYVAAAKRLVFGQIGIDMIAGPSEILVICDGQTNPRWIAYDLFSQAEHDEEAQSILLSPDRAFLDAVQREIEALLPNMSRSTVIRESLARHGALVHVRDLDEAVSLANQIASEHLELSVENPEEVLQGIRHAGAIFLGRHTPEAIGDYCAGPNHVLPTSGTARFFSPLGVYDFQKRSSLIGCSAEGVGALARTASVLARGEGLEAHALSAECRVEDAGVDGPA